MKSFLRLDRTPRLSGAAQIAVAQAVLLGLGYVTHILIGRIGGPSLYGVYGVVLSLMVIVNMLLTLGIPTATSKAVAEDEANHGGIFLAALRAQALLVLGISGATLALGGTVARVLGDEHLAPFLSFTAAIYPATAAYALLANYFNGLHAFAAQARLTIFYAVAKLAGSVGFLVLFRSVPAALSGFLVGGAAAALLALPRALSSARGHIRASVPARTLISFAGSFVGMSIALQILMSLDLFLVKRIVGDNVLVGYYSAATTIARIPYFLLQGLGFVFLPSVARLFTEDPARARSFIRDISRYLFLLLLPITALAATTSKALLVLLFSPAYAPAARPLTVLAVALGLLSSFYLLSTIAAGAGRPRVPLVLSWTLIPAAGALGFPLVRSFGLTGAAVTTLTAATTGAVLLAAFVVRRFQIFFPLPTLVRGILATAIAVTPTYAVSPPTALLPFWYLLLLTVYVLSLVALGEVRTSDLAHLRTIRPNFGSRALP